MRVACHYAIPRPPHLELDAAVQDGLELVRSVGGELNFLYPGSRPRWYIPRFLCGMHQLRRLRELDRRVDLHHIFSNGLYPYPVLRLFTRPVVFTSVIRVLDAPSWPWRFFLGRVDRIVVTSAADRDVLRGKGLPPVGTIVPGIDLGRFTAQPLIRSERFVLLAGSAPWNERQFQSKGVDLLLRAAARLPWLHLVFLWRGRLLREMESRVKRLGVDCKVEIIDRVVDVNEVLGRVHCAVVLAAEPDIIKAYPHSLIEALAAARPVLVSRCLAMAGYVAAFGCGIPVQELELEELVGAIVRLRARYSSYASRARELDMDCFSRTRMIESYIKLYEDICR